MKTFICSVLIIILLGLLISAQTPIAVSRSKTTKNVLCVETEDRKTLELKTADSKITSVIETKLNDEDSIREIVFKEILKPRISESRKNQKAYYLSVDGGKDPSENLLKKFAAYQLSIKKVSELSISIEDGDAALDKALKKQGILLYISKLDWKNKDEVTVEAGSYIGNMGSDGCTYTLKREKEEWKISFLENCFVS